MSQIAKTITLKLNDELAGKDQSLVIDPDLVEFAALAHDLGHPPFGHTGEHALDRLMMEHGGFEGNAQTLRILCRLEKKLDDPSVQLDEDHAAFYDLRGREVAVGLNLCSRSIAAILKYDREIPEVRRGGHEVVKGHYGSEADIIDQVRRDVIGDDGRPLKVVECQIMDLADDIAYSTYDLEDAFKARLLTPLDILFPSTETVTAVAERVSGELKLDFFTPEDVAVTLHQLFGDFATPEEAQEKKGLGREDLAEWYRDQVAESYLSSKLYASSGFHRTRLTSILVNGFIHAVQLRLDEAVPALSRVEMEGTARRQVSVLKHLTYVLLISSSRLQLVEHRGKQVVGAIFEALKGDQGGKLLPPDFARRWLDAPSETAKLRVCCDFIAGMTDRYALDFYARLRSEDFHSMFRLM